MGILSPFTRNQQTQPSFTTHEGRALGDLTDVRLPFPTQSFLGRSLIARFCDKIKSYSLQESS